MARLNSKRDPAWLEVFCVIKIGGTVPKLRFGIHLPCIPFVEETVYPNYCLLNGAPFVTVKLFKPLDCSFIAELKRELLEGSNLPLLFSFVKYRESFI